MRAAACGAALAAVHCAALPTPQTTVRYQQVDVGGGISLSVALAGSASPTSAVLLCHGWPETSYLWRGVIDPLLNGTTDRLLIMPDGRGFNRSSKPADVMSYNLTKDLVPDMVALVKVVAPGVKVDVVGHDWGGPVAWTFAGLYPELTRTLTIINGPHPILFDDMLHNDPAQQKLSSYMFLIDSSISPMGSPLALSTMFSTYSWFDKETKAAMHDAWSQPGANKGGLNWYRCNIFSGDLNVLKFGPKYPPPPYPQDVPLPDTKVLVIWGMADAYFDNEHFLSALPAYVPHLTVKRYDGVSHWVAQEKPDEVAADIRGFIA